MNLARLFGRSRLPPDFAWEQYLERYADLRAAGIATREAAERHWLEFGQREGRWGTHAASRQLEALGCPSVHSVYLRATGAIVCWDDVGNNTVLQAPGTAAHYGRDVYLGPPFNGIREALREGRLPFPEVCRNCLVLRTRAPHVSARPERPAVEVFQIEPSYRCTLDCPGCTRLADRRQQSPRDLDPGVLDKILGDFAESDITVHAFDFQGHGEPLMNRNLWQLTRRVRQAYPRSHVVVTTNAQGVVRAEALASGIDEVVCAIDGVDQTSFAPYRINGSFAMAYRFMSDFAARGKNTARPIKVVWKYILFEHNSTPAAIARLQELAEEAAIDELAIVFTRNGPRARNLEHPAQLELRPSSVPVSFGFHAPDEADLRARLADAAVLRLRGDAEGAEGAADLIVSVAGAFARFFRDPSALLAQHGELLAALRAEAELHPAAVRCAVDGLTAHLPGC